MALRYSYWQTVLWLLAIGATVGTCLDGLHTYGGATWYPEPQLFRSVWWVPPLFASAAVAIGMPRVFLDQKLEGTLLPVTRNAVMWKMGLFIFGYALSGFLPFAWWVKLIVLVALFVMSLWPLDTRAVFLAAAAAGLGGWFVEWQLVGRALFFHRDTQFGGVAGWIPALYALAAVAVGALAKALVLRYSRARPA